MGNVTHRAGQGALILGTAGAAINTGKAFFVDKKRGKQLLLETGKGAAAGAAVGLVAGGGVGWLENRLKPPALSTAEGATQTALGITPGGGGQSARLVELPEPTIDLIPHQEGVKYKMLAAGQCGSDHYVLNHGVGPMPEGQDFIVPGHESLAQVIEVGKGVKGLKVGDLVVRVNREPKNGVHDSLDLRPPDQLDWPGTSGMNGSFLQYGVAHHKSLVKVPKALAHDRVGVLTQPLSHVTNTLDAAYDAARGRYHMPNWRPERALVFGDGSIGILGALKMRLDGVPEVIVVGRRDAPKKAALLEQIGARYVRVSRDPEQAGRALADLAGTEKFGLVYNAATSGDPLYQTVNRGLTAIRSVVALSGTERSDHSHGPFAKEDFNTNVVIGTQTLVASIAANPEHFKRSGEYLLKAQREYPGWLSQLITHLPSLGSYAEKLNNGQLPADAIKIAVDLGEYEPRRRLPFFPRRR